MENKKKIYTFDILFSGYTIHENFFVLIDVIIGNGALKKWHQTQTSANGRSYP